MRCRDTVGNVADALFQQYACPGQEQTDAEAEFRRFRDDVDHFAGMDGANRDDRRIRRIDTS